MLNFVPYHRSHRGYVCQVAVVLFENNAVFTACQKSGNGSTINHDTRIADAIAKACNTPIEDLRFFDLQTRLSYGECSLHRPNPGDFVFDEIRWDGPNGTIWLPTICPQHVIHWFRDYFDAAQPRQVLFHGADKAQRVEFIMIAD